MANVYRILKTTLDDIADAIRAKTGGSSAMTPAEMVTAIGSIETGGGGLDVARLTPGTYVGFTVDSDGRITAAYCGDLWQIPLTKSVHINENDVISIAVMNTVRAYHKWGFYYEGTRLQMTQTANSTSPYVATITASFSGDVDSISLQINANGYSVTNMKFAWFINGKPILV